MKEKYNLSSVFSGCLFLCRLSDLTAELEFLLEASILSWGLHHVLALLELKFPFPFLSIFGI